MTRRIQKLCEMLALTPYLCSTTTTRTRESSTTDSTTSSEFCTPGVPVWRGGCATTSFVTSTRTSSATETSDRTPPGRPDLPTRTSSETSTSAEETIRSATVARSVPHRLLTLWRTIVRRLPPAHKKVRRQSRQQAAHRVFPASLSGAVAARRLLSRLRHQSQPQQRLRIGFLLVDQTCRREPRVKRLRPRRWARNLRVLPPPGLRRATLLRRRAAGSPHICRKQALLCRPKRSSRALPSRKQDRARPRRPVRLLTLLRQRRLPRLLPVSKIAMAQYGPHRPSKPNRRSRRRRRLSINSLPALLLLLPKLYRTPPNAHHSPPIQHLRRRACSSRKRRRSMTL